VQGPDGTLVASIAERRAAALRDFGSWVALLLGGWTLAWLLYDAWHGFAFPVEVHGTASSVWWLCAKLLVWILPAYVLARRAGGPGVWGRFGLTHARGLLRGVVAMVAWLCALWVQGRLTTFPSVNRDPFATFNAGIASPLFEEIIFRGFALRRLREGGVPFGQAILLTALAFGALHVPGWIFMRGFDAAIALDVVRVAFFGAVLGVVAWNVPTLWAPILVHAANNVWFAGAFEAVRRVLVG
jgi:membrane protease YdiL (CAAX protease family)